MATWTKPGRSTTYKRSDLKKSNLQTTKFVYFFVIWCYSYVCITSDQVHTISSRQDIILEWNFCDHLPPAQLKNITLTLLFTNCDLATLRKNPYNLQPRTHTSRLPGNRRPILTVNIQTACCESNHKYQTNLKKIRLLTLNNPDWSFYLNWNKMAVMSLSCQFVVHEFIFTSVLLISDGLTVHFPGNFYTGL